MRACNIFVSSFEPIGADEMAYRALRTWIALPALLLAGTPAAAQFPDKFTNLKVLPKDISKHEMESTMRSFAFALGVRCDHCHVEKKAPEKGLDFAADDKEAKKTARVMLQMVAAINHDYISKVPKTPPDAGAIQVQSVTCHHAPTQPQPPNPPLPPSLHTHRLHTTPPPPHPPPTKS